MKKILLAAVIVLLGCKAKPKPASGHWGDRTDWASANWSQTFYADSDAHKVGGLESVDGSIFAKCEDGTHDNDFRDELGEYETEEDAQAAVEKLCVIDKEK